MQVMTPAASSFRNSEKAWTSGSTGMVLSSLEYGRASVNRGQSDVVHCQLLFHLPVEYRKGKKLFQVEAAILRLVKRHGGDVTDDRAVKLIVHDNPDGKYLIKGGGPKVWKHFRLRKEHRRLQGLIEGKRCGTTENIGPAVRSAKRSQQHHLINRG